MTPPTLQQLEAYIKEKGLHVNPQAFIDHYEAADPPWTYYDRNDKQKPVRNWKQKLLMWDKIELKYNKPHRCAFSSFCKKPGIYPAGRDFVGMQEYKCVEHKPKPKPLPLPAGIIPIMKKVPQGDNRSLSDKVREARDKLKA